MNNGPALSALVCVCICFCASLSGCSSDTVITGAFIPAGSPVASLEINPSGPSMAPGTRLQLNAISRLSDHTSQPAGGVVWTSGDPGVATVDERGLVTAAQGASGSVSITADDGKRTASARVTLSPLVSLAVNPGAATIAPGTTQQFAAVGTLQNSTVQDMSGDVLWSASDGAATIDEHGLASVSSEGTGTSTVSAAFGSLAAFASLAAADVRAIAITPASVKIAPGSVQHFDASALLATGDTQTITAFAAWSSSLPDVAAVDSTGTVRTLAPGSSSITAQFGSLSGSAVLTVPAASVVPAAGPPVVPESDPSVVSLAITPSSVTLAPGAAQQFSALARFSDGSFRDVTADAVWSCSDPLIAAVGGSSADTGMVTALAAGTAKISAVFAGGVSGRALLSVSVPSIPLNSFKLVPSGPTAHPGEAIRFLLTPISSPGTQVPVLSEGVVWNSSNPSVALVSEQGVATALNIGSALITATSGSVTVSTVLIVVPL